MIQQQVAITDYKQQPKQAKEVTSAERALRLLLGIIVVGLLGILLYAIQPSESVPWYSIFGTAATLAGAFLLIGGLLGFLFGIPRTGQQINSGVPDNNNLQDGNHNQNGHLERSYQPNTNLEQISDWLTKILVGVGLTQIAHISRAVTDYADYVAPGLGGFPNSKTFAVALLLYFLVAGFLVGYLWTRLNLAQAFRRADLLAHGLKGWISEVENKVQRFEKESKTDVHALQLVLRQLNPEADEPEISQEELNTAIKDASSSTKKQIYYQAEKMRSDNWQDRTTKPLVARTIPVFRALINSDNQDLYHRNHSQLGYALKDQLDPNWLEAEAELTKAIEIRGPWQDHGWTLYEFNRAICKIHLDDSFEVEKSSNKLVKDSILEDLQAAARRLKRAILDNQDISKWMQLNRITEKEL